jgi:hypothetical protein
MLPLYYAYGVFGFTFAFISVAVQFTMLDTYHFEPAENAIAWSVVSVPWIFKPIYALMSDKPLFGYRRSYISIAAFICGIIFAYSPSIIIGKKSLVSVLTTCSFFICIADVGCDSMMVEYSKQNDISATCWFARNVGVLVATGISGIAYTHIGFEPILRITAIPVFVLALFIWDLPEKRKKHLPTTKIIKNAFATVKGMWKLLLFILISNITPELSSILFYKLKLTLNPVDISIIGLAAAGTACVVSAGYQFSHSIRGAVIVSMWLDVVAAGLAFAIAVGAPPYDYAIARAIFKAVASMLFTLPIIIYTTKQCQEGSEGTTYSIVMSWMNLTGIISEAIEGTVVNAIGITQTDLSMMSTFCLAALGITFVPLVAYKLIGDVFETRSSVTPVSLEVGAGGQET